MANKPQTVTKSRAAYTRTHFAALRAYVQRITASTIARLYFSEDEDGNEATPGWLESFLRRMQAELVELALERGSSVLAVAKPEPTHKVGMWFRPLIARRLKDTGIQTLAELVDFCNRRGGSCWRAVPRIGPGRAQRVVSWLN
ncbi:MULTISPECIES: phage integrase family protein [unclassified Caballeronia]|uniref:phage integrase family protein n=1 Tax=unclassified Caballeronia TaxID=2646786 RepID=UPI002858044A|nr:MULTISPECIES: phage integrase family protein [unclassified Caballeronia]MDR5755227.1 phage integrase family protein [Caballeronia sp. LZ024]MDR5845404.1 phage integrase family protein [Caballeronia sp. LZ031]